MRWSTNRNEFGAPGLLVGDTNKKAAHASLSPFDMHNTLVAVGPDLRRRFSDELPTGNTDLAPTVLWILGIQPPQPMDGRILSEALMAIDAAPPKSEQKTVEASAEASSLHWHQYLKVSTVGNAIYFDEGNGETVAK
jgi:arylsulfatase A-like enzyme